MRLLICFFILMFLSFPAFAVEKESAFDRVMKSGVIRCGYWVRSPMITKDLNTGKLSGAYVEYIEGMAKNMDLKIEWAGEINLSTYLQDVNQGKFDAECATGWPNSIRGKFVEYTKPIGYMPMYAYAKAGNVSFDNNLKAINKKDIRFSGHDGGTNTMVHDKFFPESQLVSVVGDAPATEPLDMIKYGKADVTVFTTFEGNAYMKENPDTLHRVESDPIRIIPVNMSVAAGEFRFLNMLNTATDEMINDGSLEKIFEKYGLDKNVILRSAKPYQE